MQVGESISHDGLDLDITPLFTQNVGGELEFYAGLEFNSERNDHEYFTTIPGVRVHTDETNKSGKLTISGTPTEATKNGHFYVAAGVNGDTPEEIISKMVKITLPDVQPADEVTPPPSETTSLEGKTWFFTEYGLVDGSDSEKGNDQIWCDSIKFDGKKVFTSVREAKNLTSCSEEVKEWEACDLYSIRRWHYC